MDYFNPVKLVSNQGIFSAPRIQKPSNMDLVRFQNFHGQATALSSHSSLLNKIVYCNYPCMASPLYAVCIVKKYLSSYLSFLKKSHKQETAPKQPHPHVALTLDFKDDSI